MKQDGKYRFSLQFPDTTEENQMVGELLERMGNRKSTLVVDAVREYLLHHPELQEGDCKIEICVTPVGIPENLEELLKKMIEERIAASPIEEKTVNDEGCEQTKTETDSLEDDISQMLDNLDFFQ